MPEQSDPTTTDTSAPYLGDSVPMTLEPQHDRVVLGMGLALIAFFMFSVMSACAKILTETYHTSEIVFLRSLVFLPFLALFLWHRRKKSTLKTTKPVAVFFRAVGGAFSMIVTYEAFKRLPLADTTVLLFTSTLIIPIMAHFILREHVGIRRWTAIIIGLCGVILMAAPTGQGNLIGLIWALSAAFLHSSMYITLRYLKTEDPMMVTFYFVAAGVVFPALFLPFYGLMPQSIADMGLFVLIGFAGGAAQICLTYAHKFAPASAVAPFNYTGLIWATGFDILIWHVVPGWPVFVGGAVIITAKLYIIWRENKIERERIRLQ